MSEYIMSDMTRSKKNISTGKTVLTANKKVNVSARKPCKAKIFDNSSNSGLDTGHRNFSHAELQSGGNLNRNVNTLTSETGTETPSSANQKEKCPNKVSKFKDKNERRDKIRFKKQETKSDKSTMAKKVEIKLRPSEIRYSQASISAKFKDGTNIGELVDDIYFGRCFASALPKIEVSQIKGRWISADNRRLWVFKQLETIGKIDFITVKVSRKIYSGKLTSGNKGLNIEIRNGEPKGIICSLLSSNLTENNNECPDTLKITGGKQKQKRRRRRRNTMKKDKDDSLNKNTESPMHLPVGPLDEFSTDFDAYPNTFADDSPNTFADDSENIVADETDSNLQFSHTSNNSFENYIFDDSEILDESEYSNSSAEDIGHNYWSEYISKPESYYNEASFNFQDTDMYSYTNDYMSMPDDIENAQKRDYVFQIANSETDIDCSREIPKKKTDADVYPIYNKNSQTCFENYGSMSEEEDYLFDLFPPQPDYRHAYSRRHCNDYRCLRCTRMLFYDEIDKGPYFEPIFSCIGDRSPENPRYHTKKVEKDPNKETILAKVSHGIGAVVGFLNKIFN